MPLFIYGMEFQHFDVVSEKLYLFVSTRGIQQLADILPSFYERLASREILRMELVMLGFVLA